MPDEAHIASGLEVPPDPVMGRVLGTLLRRAHVLSPGDVPATVAELAGWLGALECVIYLVDYDQSQLVPVPCPETAGRTALSVDGTLAGRAFSRIEVLEGDGVSPGLRRLWVPLLDGSDRLGVLEMTFPPGEASRAELTEQMITYAGLVAELVVTRSSYGDVFELVRRRRPMSLPAEVQWRLLPPLTFATQNLVIAGALEPWAQVGGDSFDYAVNAELAHLAVFDAMGHGLGATLLGTVASGAYRNARRRRFGLAETYLAIDEAVNRQFGGEQFVTGLLAELDVHTGRLRWVSAGHPMPLLLRAGKILDLLAVEPSGPMGLALEAEVAAIGEEWLEPADRLLLYTDGVVEARDPAGEFFGVERFGDYIVKEAASGRPAPEILRRLNRAVLEYQRGHLQDDATTLLVEWKGGGERRVLP
jgi:serine phosphatase RsbU (regulator of sigma subunit)